jgi:hypothetical protein
MLAASVVTADTWSGFVANNFLSEALRNNNISPTPEMMNTIGLNIMERDLSARIDIVKQGGSGLGLDAVTQADIHDAAIRKATGNLLARIRRMTPVFLVRTRRLMHNHQQIALH